MTGFEVHTETIEVIPFDTCLGAEVRGVDLARIDAGMFSVVADALETHHVIRLRGQSLSDLQLIEFAAMFGELDPPGASPYGRPLHPVHPELNVISNLKDDEGIPLGNLGNYEAVWHADLTYRDIPPKASALYAIEVPPAGGDTYFADMFAAYDALDAATKERIEGLQAIHDAAHNSAGLLRNGFDEVSDVRETPGACHPLVRTQPKTGAECLFLGRRPRSYIVGLEVAESDEFLDALWTHATQERFTWCQQWRTGDVVMWDNLAVLHRRDGFDGSYRRVMHRAQIKGTEAIA
jgi:taurine dioxygenase